MRLLANPFFALIRGIPTLSFGAVECVALVLIASTAEIAVALSLVPILASIGIGSIGELGGFVPRVYPATWLVAFAAAAGVRTFSNWLSLVKTEKTEQELVVSLQSRLYRALAAAHWDTVRRLSPPAITSALQTHSYDAANSFSSFVQLVAATFLIAGYLASSAIVFPLLTPALLAVIASIWWLNRRRSARVCAYSEDYVGATTELHQRYDDWVAISRIASLGVDPCKLANHFESGARSAAAHAIGFSRSVAATRISYDAALVAAILIGVPLAWWLETPPVLLAFGLVALVRVLPRAAAMQSGYQGLVRAVAPLQAIERLAQTLERDSMRLFPISGRLAWERIALTDIGIAEIMKDGNRRWTLRNVDLVLEHGEWLAVTGPTGAGKTTLAETMLTLIRPDEGEIRVDNVTVDSELAGRWRDQAAYVPQDVVLFDGTIRDNLRLYVANASEAELESVLNRAAAEFVFDRLPDGLDTRTGPGGRWLSGGERQRIGIARALLKRPGFLVLDEPTAALDTDTQKKLMDALGNLEHTMSVVLITHRAELLQLADRVIEIVDGRVSG